MFKNIEGSRVPNVTFKTRRGHEWVDLYMGAAGQIQVYPRGIILFRYFTCSWVPPDGSCAR